MDARILPSPKMGRSGNMYEKLREGLILPLNIGSEYCSVLFAARENSRMLGKDGTGVQCSVSCAARESSPIATPSSEPTRVQGPPEYFRDRAVWLLVLKGNMQWERLESSQPATISSDRDNSSLLPFLPVVQLFKAMPHIWASCCQYRSSTGCT